MNLELGKILNAEQTKAADEFTIKNEPISSINLMERASNTFVEAILLRINQNQKIAVICGTGNNGGDGFAVARILEDKGYQIYTFLVGSPDKLSSDCKTNYERLVKVQLIHSENQIPDFNRFDSIIDALFGSGLNRPVGGITVKCISAINKSNTSVLSIDLPSGLFADKLPPINEEIIKADFTVSFQRPKWSFFFPETGPFIKEWTVVDIGLDEAFIQRLESSNFVLDGKISNKIQNRNSFSHKGTYGHALIIAGSYGKMGAAVLSAKACLRSGAGLVTAYIPACGYEIMQVSLPEAMCITDPQTKYLSHTLESLKNYSAIGIGPGIDKHPDTKTFLKNILEKTTKPVVLDADALNIISEDKTLFNLIPKNSILTPHPKEFERLMGSWKNTEERLTKLKSLANKINCIIVLKDAHTAVCTPEGQVYFNTSGNAGMATGGSGDVLTGIITGLLSQNYSPTEAALIGVYYHGKAGDFAAEKRGMNGMTASDIIDNLRIEKT